MFAVKKSLSTPVLKILYHPNQLGYPRLGMAVAKKQLALSVSRNRIKRLIRESFRHHAAEMVACDLVVMVRRPIQDMSNELITQQLAEQWARLNLLLSIASKA